MLRYVIEPVTLDENRNLDPNKTVFFIKDLDKNYTSKSYYLTFEAAEKVVKKKNLANVA